MVESFEEFHPPRLEAIPRCGGEHHETVIIHLTKPEYQNLMKNSVYYATSNKFDNVAIVNYMTLTLTTPPSLEQGLCIYLIALNTKGIPTLPNFEATNIRSFVEVCAYYHFEVMLDQMVEHCLHTGLCYLPAYLEALLRVYGDSDIRVHKLTHRFQSLWNEHQIDPFHVYFGYSYGDIVVVPARDILVSGALRAMVRSLIQSPSLRCRPFYPVCPICETPLQPTEQLRLTPCCRELVHTACQWQFKCEICLHDQHRFSNGALRSAQIMVDSKYLNWFPCFIHKRCKVLYRNRWNTLSHCHIKKLRSTYLWDAKQFFGMDANFLSEGAFV